MKTDGMAKKTKKSAQPVKFDAMRKPLRASGRCRIVNIRLNEIQVVGRPTINGKPINLLRTPGTNA